MKPPNVEQKVIKNTAGPRFQGIVMGASAGGLAAWNSIFPLLPADFHIPIVAVQHIHPSSDDYMVRNLNELCALTVEVGEDKQPILPGHIYFAPTDYHLFVEREGTFSLSVDPKVNHSRPSIDVLFESAARAWSSGVIGILLTGASNDGAEGLKAIKEAGGLTVVQDPEEAEYSVMPGSALALTEVDRVLSIHRIGIFLRELNSKIGRKD